MKIYIKNLYERNFNLKIDWIEFVDDILLANKYNLSQFIFNDEKIIFKTLFIDEGGDIFCFDISLLKKNIKKYFYICNINDLEIINKIIYFYKNISWIAISTLSKTTNLVSLNYSFFDNLSSISTKEFLSNSNFNKKIIVKNDSLSPDNLVVSDSLYKLYEFVNKKLELINDDLFDWNIFFADFILSLISHKYWVNSLFFLKSNLKFRVSTFLNNYDDVISLHIPVARSKYIWDLFESLLLQSNKDFKIVIWVDWYDKKQKWEIKKIVNNYKNKFNNFDYFINKKNLWVWKTRWKLLKKDKFSRYVVFLDDDNFLSSNSIDFIYNNINKYKNMWIYSIENIDVRFDVNYKDYIYKRWNFNQPWVYTNRERVNRLTLYCNQEETPLIHDRFYSDLLDIKYNSFFDACSIDMVFNRFLEIVCWNVNLRGAFQFMRIWHQYHQTRTDGYEIKEFAYVMYILKTISDINNNNYYFSYMIKTLIPKQNDLFN